MWRPNDKLITVSCSLAAGGILACLAALFNTLVLSRSTVEFLVGLVALPVMIAIIVMGFVALCDGCEDFLHTRRQPPKKGKRTAADNRRPSTRDAARSEPFYPLQRIGDFRDRYVGGLRGASHVSASVSGSTINAKRWHGQ
jgi:hypothetical protein